MESSQTVTIAPEAFPLSLVGKRNPVHGQAGFGAWGVKSSEMAVEAHQSHSVSRGDTMLRNDRRAASWHAPAFQSGRADEKRL
jgi:hypothetical protein